MSPLGRSNRTTGNSLKAKWDFHFKHVDFDPPLPAGTYGGAVRLWRGWQVTICRRKEDPNRPPDARGIPVTVCSDTLDKAFAAAAELLAIRTAEYVSVRELMGGSWYAPRDWTDPNPPPGQTIEPVEE